MQKNFNINEFRRQEDGSLLVFFCVCIVAILGLVALSFDMGRRASTQSDMQSFADNVALAAAGELDGQPDAITRATAAAQNVIQAANETLKVGASGTNQQLSMPAITGNAATDGLVFYSTLPATDRPASFAVADLSNPANASYKYGLPSANVTADPTQAFFVGVRLNNVPVSWMFGNIFGSNLTTSTDIGAVAIAGNTAYTCDISPLMFCLPREPDPSGPPGATRAKFLNPGQGVRLQTVGQNAAWNAGQFGFLDISAIPAAAAGPCASETPESRKQACLLARGISACFNSRRVNVQTGQRSGQEAAAFNLPFGIVGQVMNNLATGQNAQYYGTGPHTISGQVLSGGCNNNAVSNSDYFPLDDCHAAGNCPDGRFGNGTWAAGRSSYVTNNYTVDDPSNPGTPLHQGSWFDFPVANMTRYQFYQNEILRAANGGVMSQYVGPQYQVDVTPTTPPNNVAAYDTWDEFWPNSPSGLNPIIPSAQGHADDGLQSCGLPVTNNIRRRVVIAAGIDCPPGQYVGTVPGDVPVAEYYEVFLLAPARDIPNSTTGPGNNDPLFEIHVEVIQPVGGAAGASTVDAGIFREVIQLFK